MANFKVKKSKRSSKRRAWKEGGWRGNRYRIMRQYLEGEMRELIRKYFK